MLIHRILGGVAYDQAGAGGGQGGGGAGQGQQGAGAGGDGGQQGAGGNPTLEMAKKIVADLEKAGGGQGGQGNQGGGQGGNQGGQQGTGYRPDGLPDHLYGASDKETLDKLWGAYKPARDTIAQRGAAPEKPDGYKIEISDAQKKLFSTEDLSKDPAIKVWTKVAHKHGLTNKEFNIFGEFFEEMAKAGLADPKIDPNAELDELGKALAGEKDPIRLRAHGAQRMVAANTWLQGLETRKVLDQAEREILSGLATTARGVGIIEKLMQLGAAHGVQPGLDAGSGAGDQQSEHEKRMRAMFPSMAPRGTPR